MPSPTPIRVRLDLAAFRDLCAGRVVELRSVRGEIVQLILADIGMVPALQAVLDGMGAGHNTGLGVRVMGKGERGG